MGKLKLSFSKEFIHVYIIIINHINFEGFLQILGHGFLCNLG